MKKEQAEIRSQGLNRYRGHPSVSYRPQQIEPTKWERDRWAVIQMFDDRPVGIAAT